FATDLSYDPRLLALLSVPIDPLVSVELYNRVGGVALAFAVAALVLRPTPVVKAWAVLLAVALVLMLGRFVPLLPELLHRLPLVNVFRGPVRHNFEFGLALAVLAGFGFQAVFWGERRVHNAWRWAVFGALGAALVAGVCWYASQRLPEQPQVRATFKALRPFGIAFGASALACGTWIIAAAGTRARKLLLGVALAAPLVEARVALRVLDRLWPDNARIVAQSDFRSDTARFTRILPPRLSSGRIDALGLNSVLLFPGLQHLHGYASIAPSDAAQLLDLDMHGHARAHADLAWSRLPSLYGVTHLILNEAVCQGLRFGVDAARVGGACRELSDPSSETSPSQPLAVHQCQRALADAVTDWSVQLTPSGPAGTPPVHAQLWNLPNGPSVVEVLRLPPSRGRSRIRTFRRSLPAHARLSLSPAVERTAHLSKATLWAERFEPVAELAATAKLTLFAAHAERDRVRFAGDNVIQRAELWFEEDWRQWPDTLPRGQKNKAADREWILEVEARAEVRPRRPLVVDLYAPGYDPEAAQLAVEPSQLGANFAVFSRRVAAPEPPRRLALRVLVQAGDAIEVRRARLLAVKRHVWAELVASSELGGRDFDLNASELRIGPNGYADLELHFPVRPLSAVLELEPVDHAQRLAMGISADPRFAPGTERLLDVAPGSGPRRYSYTTNLDLQANAALLRVRSVSGGALRVKSLWAEDACSVRRYVEKAKRANGFRLYENPNALPRVFSVQELRPTPSLESARQILREDVSFDPKRTALVIGEKARRGLSEVRVETRRFEAQRLALTVNVAAGQGFLVVNDRFHPRWHARMDGRIVPMIRTNGLVRGVFVPAGRHELEMFYEPPWTVWVGAALALLGVALGLFSRRLEDAVNRFAAARGRTAFVK
ncbi:MAG TPA: hypothetical protein VK524_22445, partial [Polyangiaceae bacterium]|nr:hypothetical protein [Polyangiaceae bacterium]